MSGKNERWVGEVKIVGERINGKRKMSGENTAANLAAAVDD